MRKIFIGLLLLIASFVISPSVSAQATPTPLPFDDNKCAQFLRAEISNGTINQDSLFQLFRDPIERHLDDPANNNYPAWLERTPRGYSCQLVEILKPENFENPPNGQVEELLKGEIYGACWSGVAPEYSTELINQYQSLGTTKLSAFQDACSDAWTTLDTASARVNIIDVVFFPRFMEQFRTFAQERFDVEEEQLPTATPVQDTTDLDLLNIQDKIRAADCGVEGKKCCIEDFTLPGEDLPAIGDESNSGWFEKLTKPITRWAKDLGSTVQNASTMFFETFQSEQQNPCWDGSAYRFYKDRRALDYRDDADRATLDPLFRRIVASEKWLTIGTDLKAQGLTCQCERDAGRKTVGSELRQDTLGVSDSLYSPVEITNNTLGAFDEYDPDGRGGCSRNINDSQCNEVVVQNYCASLKVSEKEKRFGDRECDDTLRDRVETAERRCDSLNLIGEVEEYGECKKCIWLEEGAWTTLGCFYSDFERTLSERVFSLVIGIAGTVAFGCILYAAFLMQTSAGNPEKTGKAQELMTSCISGLVIIIFSVFILRVIGVDILRIPGFTGESDTREDVDLDEESLAPAGVTPTATPRNTPTTRPAAAPTTGASLPNPTSPAGPSPTTIALVTGPVSSLTPSPAVSSTPLPVPSPTLIADVPSYDCDTSRAPEKGEAFLYDSTTNACLRISLAFGYYPELNDQINNHTVNYYKPWSFWECDNWDFNDCLDYVVIGPNTTLTIWEHKEKNKHRTGSQEILKNTSDVAERRDFDKLVNKVTSIQISMP